MTQKAATLYELTGAWLDLYDMADDPDMDADAFFDTMEGIEGEIEVKADGYARVINQLIAQAKNIKAEETRLFARRRAIENSVARMKESLQNAMEATGKTKFKTDLFSFGIQNNPSTVVLDCEVLDLPKELIKYSEPTADKKAIMDILKAGTEFPFAHLEQSKSLRIR